MMDPIRIDGVLAGAAGLPAGEAAGAGAAKPSGRNFADMLENLVKEADDLQKTSDRTVQDFASGQVEDVHEVMFAMTKADLSFRLMLEVRNKLVEAYQEVMRTQM